MYDFRVIDVHKFVDGDTVDLRIDVGFRTTLVQRIRLAIVDTPERGQAGYFDATAFTREWLMDRPMVRVTTYKEDSFGRWIGDVYDARTGETVSGALLEMGLADVWS